MGNSALGRGTAVEENKVKASSGDGSPDFLDQKVDGTTMTVVGDQLVRAALTGDVTTSGNAATLESSAVNGQTDTVITAADEILFGDVTDSNNLKKDTVQGILDLAGGGGAWVLEQSNTFSSATTVTVTETLTGGDFYQIVFRGNQSADTSPIIRINNSSSATYGYLSEDVAREGGTQVEYNASTPTDTSFQLTNPSSNFWDGSAPHLSSSWLIVIDLFYQSSGQDQTCVHIRHHFVNQDGTRSYQGVLSGNYRGSVMNTMELISGGGQYNGRYWVLHANNS